MESIRSYQEWAMSLRPRTVSWNNTYGAVAFFPRSAVNLFHCFTITGRVGPAWLLLLMVTMSLAAFFTASAALKCDRSAKNEYTREYVAIEFLLVGVTIVECTRQDAPARSLSSMGMYSTPSGTSWAITGTGTEMFTECGWKRGQFS